MAFWTWIRAQRGTAVSAIIGFLFVYACTRILDWAIDDPAVRDIAVVIVVSASVIGFWGVALWSVVNPTKSDPTSKKPDASEDRTPATAEEVKEIIKNQAATLAPQNKVPAPEVPPTGETLVSAVSKSIDPFHPNKIDYHESWEKGYPHKAAYENLRTLLTLRLGEVALLRRLAVAKNETQDRYRCEQVLDAAGVNKPGGSIVKLHDMGWLQQSDGVVTLTALGREYSWVFSMALTHDGELVRAYRQITPQINDTVRFDNRPISTT